MIHLQSDLSNVDFITPISSKEYRLFFEESSLNPFNTKVINYLDAKCERKRQPTLCPTCRKTITFQTIYKLSKRN